MNVQDTVLLTRNRFMLFAKKSMAGCATLISLCLVCGCAQPETDPTTKNDPTTMKDAATVGDDALKGDTHGQSSAEIDVDMLRWSTRMRPKETVRMFNEHGDINVKNSADSGLIYAGTYQKLDGEKRDPELRTNRFAGGLELIVNTPDDWNGRLDAGVRVPKDAALMLSTVDGNIVARIGDNPINAETEGGAIRLRTKARIDATSINGDITVTFEKTQYGENAGEIISDGGNIDVWLRPDASLRVVLSAPTIENGIPESDATVTRNNDGTTQVELGDNGAELRATTQTGTLRVNVVPLPIAAPTQDGVGPKNTQ